MVRWDESGGVLLDNERLAYLSALGVAVVGLERARAVLERAKERGG
jgi:hypothetical protein